MNTTSFADAYARYDIMNLLAGFDPDWALRMQNSAQLVPTFYQRFQGVIVINANEDDFFKNTLVNGLDPDIRDQFKIDVNRFSSKNFFFYGSISLASIELDNEDPIKQPLWTIKLSVHDGVKKTKIAIPSNNGNSSNAMQYNSGSANTNLFNYVTVYPNLATGPDNAFLSLDGIFIGLPKV